MTSKATFQGALTTRTQMALETLAHAPFNHLTRLLAREYFSEFSHSGTFKPYMSIFCFVYTQLCSNFHSEESYYLILSIFLVK